MLNKLFEKIGSCCCDRKKVVIIIGITILPFIMILGLLLPQHLKLQDAHARLDNLHRKVTTTFNKRKKTKTFLSTKTSFDPYYINNYLENLTFLEKEIQIYETLISHPAFIHNENIKSRLSFLKNENKLSFHEENIKSSSLIKETEENQNNVIEINEDDLKKLLCLIEDVKVDEHLPLDNSPQLIIKNFNLKKSKDAVFLLNINLLKREYLKKINHE